MTPNDVQLRKLHKRFQLLDINGNGYLELADYQAIAYRFQAQFALPTGSPKAVLIEQTYTRLFTALHRWGDHDHDGRIDQQEFVRTTTASLLGRPDGFERAILPVVQTVMHVCDKDDNAALDAEEFRRFLTAEGATPADCALAFTYLCPPKAAGLTLDRFAEATRQFYCSPDPDAPGNRLFGDV
jgi:Ca2+-binding EF-hand superfamily protein